MVDRAKSCGYENVGFIFDRGYFSRENIKYCDDNSYAFMIMARGNAKFVSRIVEEQMTGLKLMRASLFQKDRKNYTVPSAIRMLESLEISKLPDGKYHQMYALTKRQKAILGVYGITPAEYQKSVGKINSELSIISG